MTSPTPNIYYSTGGSPPFIPDDGTPTNTNEPYLDWLNFILSQPEKIPQTFTTSYGDDEQSVSRRVFFIGRFCVVSDSFLGSHRLREERVQFVRSARRQRKQRHVL